MLRFRFPFRFLKIFSVAPGPAIVLGLFCSVAGDSAVSAAQVTLRWRDNSNNESGFQVERATGSGSFAQIATVGAQIVSYVDDSAAANTTYNYRIRAYNGLGNSGFTNVVTIATPGAANTAPTISALSSRTISTNGTTGAIAFAVSDAQTAAANLGVAGTSSNPTLVPNANITLGGSGGNRTVTVVPAANKTGTATIAIAVSDGALSATSTFLLTVSSPVSVNTAPRIGSLADRTVALNRSTGAIAFTVSDAETTAGSLRLSATSSNPVLVPLSGIVLGGSGANRTATVAPAIGKTGSARVTIQVSDGTLSAVNSFLLTVAPASPVLTSSDINGPTLAGSMTSSNGTIQIRAAGTDIWGRADQFHFARQQLTGDAEMIVRVTGLPLTHDWTKAGLMFRASLAADAPHVSVLVTPSHGVVVQWRAQSGADSQTTSGLPGTAPEWLKLARTGDTFNAFRSENGLSWERVGSAPVDLPDVALGGLAVTSHNPSSTTTATFDSFTVNGAGAPSPGTPVTPPSPVLTSSDINAPALAGAMTSSNGTIQIRAAGADVWGRADQFHFARRQLTGDAEMIVRVAGLPLTHDWTKAGLMFRASLAADAPHVSVLVTPSHGVVLQWRAQSGADSQSSAGLAGTAPEWLKLVRTGDTFYAFRSENGLGWELVEFVQVDLPDAAYGGLAVTSHNPQAVTTATFDSFAVD